METFSYYDASGRDVEKVYQAFLLGMLIHLADYEVSSNREAGVTDILRMTITFDGKQVWVRTAESFIYQDLKMLTTTTNETKIL